MYLVKKNTSLLLYAVFNISSDGFPHGVSNLYEFSISKFFNIIKTTTPYNCKFVFYHKVL